MLIVACPVRVSFLGGGTDLPDFYLKYGGAVLTTTINKYVNVEIYDRFDDEVVAKHKILEVAGHPKEIKHELIREAMLDAGIMKGIEINTHSDIHSEGSGLGTSSAYLVALLHGLSVYKNEIKTQKELAELAADIEINRLCKPIGIQDHYIAAFGGLRLITFYKEVRVETVHISDSQRQLLNDNLLMFYTGITRQSSDILIDQKKNIPDRIEVLSQMRDLAIMGKARLELGDLDGFGVLLNENWELKKKLSDRITNPVIDEMYNKAMQAGAVGAKILGSGGGGFLLVYARNGERDAVRAALSDYRELPIHFEQLGSRVIFDNRRSS